MPSFDQSSFVTFRDMNYLDRIRPEVTSITEVKISRTKYLRKFDPDWTKVTGWTMPRTGALITKADQGYSVASQDDSPEGVTFSERCSQIDSHGPPIDSSP